MNLKVFKSIENGSLGKKFSNYFRLIFAIFYKDFNLMIKIFAGFFVLCISASSNYLINEYCDRDFDKNHPKMEILIRTTKF